MPDIRRPFLTKNVMTGKQIKMTKSNELIIMTCRSRSRRHSRRRPQAHNDTHTAQIERDDDFLPSPSSLFLSLPLSFSLFRCTYLYVFLTHYLLAYSICVCQSLSLSIFLCLPSAWFFSFSLFHSHSHLPHALSLSLSLFAWTSLSLTCPSISLTLFSNSSLSIHSRNLYQEPASHTCIIFALHTQAFEFPFSTLSRKPSRTQKRSTHVRKGTFVCTYIGTTTTYLHVCVLVDESSNVCMPSCVWKPLGTSSEIKPYPNTPNLSYFSLSLWIPMKIFSYSLTPKINKSCLLDNVSQIYCKWRVQNMPSEMWWIFET